MQLSVSLPRPAAVGLQRRAAGAPRGRAGIVVRAGLGEDLINKLTVRRGGFYHPPSHTHCGCWRR